MAKLTRERQLRERREIKQAKKAARRAAAAAPDEMIQPTLTETEPEPVAEAPAQTV